MTFAAFYETGRLLGGQIGALGDAALHRRAGDVPFERPGQEP